MEKLTNDQMENLVGGDYCDVLYTMIFKGEFQGDDELSAQAVGYFDQYCSDYDPN
ncbi:hypothetical protein [Algoriphagus winogradskyi]|uniref:Bacteriocin-type signal sequence-containing protein n=1 Tax=Algoriphagus winogradskyi TaxID=237017 RepID=A0ABY1PGC9_9BACT|nr:hypothetical protein [Algoriphagus winogradskyi]SMP33777.1 hypothetical protein SAMN06265367_1092 [Algoriphagus winogradskyi]